MDMILDALNGKVSPNTMYHRAVHYFQDSGNRDNVRKTFTDIADNVSGSFKRNPLPVMMIAAGTAWMVWETQRDGRGVKHDGYGREKFENVKDEAGERINQARENGGERMGNIQGKAHETADIAHARAGEFKDKARDTFYSAKERAGSALGGARQKGDEYRSEMQGSAQQSVRRADSAVHHNPLLYGFAAAFAGIVAGLILPESKSEHDLAAGKTPGVIDKLKEKGAELTNTTRAAVEQAKQPDLTGEQQKPKTKETITEGERTTQFRTKEEAVITPKPAKPADIVRTADASVKKPDEKSSQQKGSLN
jgi:ElaB/YqjD/DUF883 family membrane-anchored ribosome-binding protein